jgi:hypothetical protein
MRSRVILTSLWLAAFIIQLGVMVQYTRCSPSGTCVPPLLSSQLVQTAQPIIVLFGGHLAVVLGFWFLRPFKPPATDTAERFRFVIALVCTLLFLGVVILLAAGGLFPRADQTVMVKSHVDDAVKVGEWMSFLVAPVNAFYFGAKDAGG